MKIQILLIATFLVMIGLFSTPAFAQQFEDLDYKIRGGEILSFEIDEDTATLKILIDARARGELVITLPRYLIDAKINSEDTDFEILVSGLKLLSHDEINTQYDRTITIPFKRGNGEFLIIGTHVFSQPPVTQTTSQKSMDQIIQSELQTQIPDGKAKLMVFSNTDWSGAFQSSSFDYTEINGNSDESVTFGCESSFGSQGVFGAKIKKLTQDGYLKILVIQDQKVVAEGSTEDDFGEVLINGNCVSSFSSSPTGGGCLIATATYGSEMSPQVQQLRELRDNSLLQTESGTLFMKTFNNFYYSFSPIIADYERENPAFKEVVKIVITPLLSSLTILNFVDMNSEVKVLGYGISLIILNGMMYVGIPIVAVVGIRRIF